MKWKIGWGLTNSCNMNCPFCYSKKARQDGEDISLECATRFIDENHEYIDSINYGTGENTLSNNWRCIAKYITENYPDIGQALTTNGYLSEILLDQENEDILQSLEEVDISFDMADKNEFNKLRGISSAYDWVMKTINICKKYNIKTTLVTILIEETMHIENLKNIIEISRTHDCFLRLNIFRPNINQDITPVKYELLKDTLLWVINNTSIVSLCDPLFSALIIRKKATDNSGKSSLRILPNGSVTPSTYLVSDQWVFGNIKDGVSLKENPFKTMAKEIDLEDNIPDDCIDCPIANQCMGGAMDRRVIWYNTLKKRDPYCPYENDDNLETWNNKTINYIEKGPVIHDGYLPTLIFKP